MVMVRVNYTLLSKSIFFFHISSTLYHIVVPALRRISQHAVTEQSVAVATTTTIITTTERTNERTTDDDGRWWWWWCVQIENESDGDIIKVIPKQEFYAAHDR